MAVKGPDDFMNDAVLWAVWWGWTAVFLVTRWPWALAAAMVAATIGTVTLASRLALRQVVRRRARRGG